eukprot:12904104-Prorocentrum_lima.AAC.1
MVREVVCRVPFAVGQRAQENVQTLEAVIAWIYEGALILLLCCCIGLWWSVMGSVARLHGEAEFQPF